MITILKWSSIAAGALLATLLIFWGALVLQSERRFSRAFEDVNRIEFDRMEVERAGEVSRTIRIHSVDGREVLCEEVWEKGSVGGFPAEVRTALFLLGGVETGKNAAHLVEPFPGTVVISAEYPLKVKLPGSDIPSKIGSSFALIDGAAESLPAFALIIRYLKECENIDSIVLVGTSLGVPYTTILAALAPPDEVDGLALLYGGGKMGIILERAIDVGPPWFRALLGAALGRVLAPVDPAAHIAAVSPVPICLINADHDPRVPDEAVRALREAAGEPKKIVVIEGGGHVKPGKRNLLERARKEVGIWLVEIGIID